MIDCVGVCFAVGGDSLIGGPLFPPPTPTDPTARRVLAASVGVVVAAFIESFAARQERYKPFALAALAAACWGVVALIDDLHPRPGSPPAETAVWNFLSDWFPVVGLVVWVAVSLPGTIKAIRQGRGWSVARRWAAAIGVGATAGAVCYARDTERGSLVDAEVASQFGLVALWMLGLVFLTLWAVVRWLWASQTTRRT